MALNLFSFDPSKGETPETLKERRRIAAALAGYDRPQNVGEGIGAVLRGLASGIMNNRASAAEKAGRAGASDRFNGVLGALAGFPARPSANNLPSTETGQQIRGNSPAIAERPVTNDVMDSFIGEVKKSGLTNPYGLAAVASTGRAESGWDPKKVKARWSDPSQSGQPGTSGGILSWRNERLTNLENYAKLAGEDPSNISPATQARFLAQEDPKLFEALNGAKSVEEAQDLMNNAWKFAGYNEPSQERARRLGYAQEYLPSFQATETASLDPSVGMPAAEAANTEWLRYANDKATRSQPISNDLQSALSFLPELGVQMEVFSGGQPGIGEGGARTGSTRHDHGGAADVFFYKDGRKLDWRNPADVPIFEEIVRRGKANGITGFGAGDGYMQAGSMHLGFGKPAVWGAGGRGANAAEWLRNAYASADSSTPAVAAIDGAMNGGETELAPIKTQADQLPMDDSVQRALANRPRAGLADVIDPIPGRQVAQALSQGPSTEQLLGIISDEWSSDSQRSIAEALLRQNFEAQQSERERIAKQNDPAYRLGLQKLQAEVDALQNPRMSPGDQARLEFDQRKFDAEQEAKSKISPVDQARLDLDRQRFEADKADKGLTGDIKEYNFYEQKELAAGRQPLGPLEWDRARRSAGASQVNVDQRAEGAFDKKLAEKQAETFSTMADEGVTARSDIAVIDELGALLQGQGGTLSGLSGILAKYGIGGDGAGDLQAAQALINKLVPTQRQAGSGSMSDRDVELFTRSLPSLWNSPGGNEKILNVMRGLAQYKIAQGDIANSVINGDLSREEGRRALAALPNPLEEFRNPKKEDPAEGMPMQGQVVDGYRYKGGDPADLNSWELVQ